MSKITPSRPVILCFVAYYLPGYRSGGPVRTIANFVDHLGDEFDIRIVTRDRDALDAEPYPSVRIDVWNKVGKAQVFYASKKTVNLRAIAKLIRETPHDVLYLNSFFAFDFTTLPLLARRLGWAPKAPCVIAPRGEFSKGAIALKARKKRLYMRATRMMGLYAGLHWQASSEFEVSDIQRELGGLAAGVSVAPNLPPGIEAAGLKAMSNKARSDGPLRVVFLSRISPMKNLDFLLGLLLRVRGPIELLIYGPIGDNGYWSQCQALIARLPANIQVKYLGEVTPLEVPKTFASADLFVFPTRGENFGHVVLEALCAGTAVLISDRTPWLASDDKAVEVLPLEDAQAWVNAIERWAGLDGEQLLQIRTAALSYAQRYLETSSALEDNRTLFHKVCDSARSLSACATESVSSGFQRNRYERF